MWINELFIASLTILTFAIASNWIRNNRRFEIELKPNCLLTRYPVVFATGPKSIFYFLSYWNKTPEFLKQHGYEVMEFNLPWRNRTQRAQAWVQFISWLESENKKCHLIIDESTVTEIESLWQSKPACIQTLTVLTAQSSAAQNVRAKELKPSSIGIEFVKIETGATTTATLLEKALWFFHQFSSAKAKKVSPLVLGLTSKNDKDPVFHQFLDLCIALAERDMR